MKKLRSLVTRDPKVSSPDATPVKTQKPNHLEDKQVVGLYPFQNPTDATFE